MISINGTYGPGPGRLGLGHNGGFRDSLHRRGGCRRDRRRNYRRQRWPDRHSRAAFRRGSPMAQGRSWASNRALRPAGCPICSPSRNSSPTWAFKPRSAPCQGASRRNWGAANFLQGMGQGALTAAYGFIFNDAWELAVEDVLGPYRGQEAGIYENDPLIYSDQENQGWGALSSLGNDLSFPSFGGGQAAEGSSWIGVWGQGSTPSSWQVQEWKPVGQVNDIELYRFGTVPEGQAAHMNVTLDAFFFILRSDSSAKGPCHGGSRPMPGLNLPTEKLS